MGGNSTCESIETFFEKLNASGALPLVDAALAPSSQEHAEIVREGVALTFEEPQLVWTPRGVYSFSFRNPVCRVSASWSEFLGDWLASGAFRSHDIDGALAVTAPFLPAGSVAPEENRWLKAYRALHGAGEVYGEG